VRSSTSKIALTALLLAACGGGKKPIVVGHNDGGVTQDLAMPDLATPDFAPPADLASPWKDESYHGNADAGDGIGDMGTLRAVWNDGAGTVLAVGDYGTVLRSQAGGAFALDPSGHPRLLLQDLLNGTFYGQCNASCTQFASWTFNQFLVISAQADLKFTASGHPRVAFESAAPNVVNGQELYSAGCDGDCGNEANWPGVALLAVVTALVDEPFALDLDSQDRPRIAFYYAVGGAHKLSYAWCDASCTTPAAGTWNAFDTGLPAYSGYKGVALALDASDVPHLAYGASPDGISRAVSRR